jgi:hypothetical protein
MLPAQHPSPAAASTWRKTQRRCPACFALMPTEPDCRSNASDQRQYGTQQNDNYHPAAIHHTVCDLSHLLAPHDWKKSNRLINGLSWSAGYRLSVTDPVTGGKVFWGMKKANIKKTMSTFNFRKAR